MADKSLEDVILERNLGSSGRRGRGRGNFRRGRGRGSRVISTSQAFQRNVGAKNPNKGIGRIASIQNSNLSSNLKSRLGIGRGGAGSQKTGGGGDITDARDKLNLIARRTDAREKLNLLARQTDARAKLTAKRKLNPLVVSLKKNVPPAPKRPLMRTIKNNEQPEVFSNKITFKTTREPEERAPLQFTVRNNPTLTIRNPAARPYQSTSIPLTTTKRMLSSSSRDDASFGTFRSDTRMRIPVEASPPKIPRLAPPNISAAAVLNPRTKPISSVEGSRVMVSNLQHTVTEEDIKELFGAIGILKRARLVRQGLAEVIYTKKESALEAINTYHSRELDGKPMNCKLDTGGTADGGSFKKNAISDKFKTMRSENNPNLPFKTNTSGNVVELDKTVIQKVLFKSLPASAAPSKAVVFTVKI